MHVVAQVESWSIYNIVIGMLRKVGCSAGVRRAYYTIYVLAKPPVATFVKSKLGPRMLNKQLIKEFCAVDEDPTLVVSSPGFGSW